MTTTNRTPATAADFVEYVAEARAEGLSDAEILVRYFKQARPDRTLRIHADAVAIYCDRCEIEWGTLPAGEAGDYHVTITAGYKLLATETFDDLESALAWLANQLAERCPVAAMTDEEGWLIEQRMQRGEKFPKDARFMEYDARSSDRRTAHPFLDRIDGEAPDEAAARIQRMFGIGEVAQ